MVPWVKTIHFYWFYLYGIAKPLFLVTFMVQPVLQIRIQQGAGIVEYICSNHAFSGHFEMF
jgi:hypothetical protein